MLPRFFQWTAVGLLGAMLGGCMSLSTLPYECATAIDAIPSCGCLVAEDCQCAPGPGICACAICRSGGLCALARHHHRGLMIAVGPPAVRYEPPMPPEFLPVPTHPIYANVNMDAPQPTRGTVDVGWERELLIEARD